MVKNSTKNSLDDLQKKFKNMQKKIEKYEGEQKITLPYSEEEWNNMTEYEKNEAIKAEEKNYVDRILKDVFYDGNYNGNYWFY